MPVHCWGLNMGHGYVKLTTVLHFQMIMATAAAQRVQQWRAFSVLAEDGVQFPTPVRPLTTTYNSSSWGSEALSWLPCMHMVFRHTRRQKLIRSNNFRLLIYHCDHNWWLLKQQRSLVLRVLCQVLEKVLRLTSPFLSQGQFSKKKQSLTQGKLMLAKVIRTRGISK